MREAARQARVVAKKDTATRAGDHARAARAAFRAECLTAHREGMTTTALANAVGTSWSRMNQILKQAQSEERVHNGAR